MNAKEKAELIQAKAKELASLIESLCAESVERSNALTDLEDSVLWAKGAIARYS